jgi:hypothetical protein
VPQGWHGPSSGKVRGCPFPTQRWRLDRKKIRVEGYRANLAVVLACLSPSERLA